ncbi:hypothetical protein G7Y79_00012g032040 [Physcia stellaris]|nr:hypothetical protein G7Y79_00012g032040 [Physcia stellaris]
MLSLIFTILLLLGAVIAFDVEQPSSISKRAFNHSSYGEYNIYNCDDGSRTVELGDLLSDLESAVRSAIRDSKRKTPSAAFRTFFKTSSSAPFVTKMLTNVLRGMAKTPPRPPESPNGSPTLYCITGPNQFVSLGRSTTTGDLMEIDWYDQCLPDTTALYPSFDPPLPFITLCELFWSQRLPAYPPERNCIGVSKYTNWYRENGNSLVNFRLWVLLEELMHYYLYTETQNRIEEQAEVYNINDCVMLPANMAKLNAVSYVYYVANLYGKCQAFPKPPDGRELLEVDGSDDVAGNGFGGGTSGLVPGFNATNVTIAS